MPHDQGGRRKRRQDERVRRLTRHVVIPAVMPAAFFSVALTPVAVLGCRNRGLLALLVALASGILAVRAAAVAAKGGARRDADAFWWAVRSAVLAIPVAALLAMA